MIRSCQKLQKFGSCLLAYFLTVKATSELKIAGSIPSSNAIGLWDLDLLQSFHKPSG